ncbi:cytochrome aa3 quinol oxidase subunit II [Priestia filamentosa]|uniref:Quinol oxidase subunit 2 n=1 Tax=Priestia filamentosa TaxID=1402861 RepID=A0A1X7G865_9BACI|nr:cytochrome aa3 quinol oxidase subunit II [Priestia filamentosa]AKO94841.1 cytochrome aa3 quinol oxidase subunit II [Priestia filamentosa]MDT3765179.1 cytochrome aa3 quinol oxidase subunit II [Priestia filamentosa]OXS65687.1 cytochrome aa3 quinol oxidase subunit II [Priestia filamentosa]RJS66036.1 cytochrome aa3 quinol oxidase subunit II [Priestia filamentosa]WRU95471.1 cytochrome aa3 quinol oxidase subunit II [Priestia filamentosa]
MKKLQKVSRKWISLSALAILFLLSGCDLKMGVLNPQGPVAQTQYDLIMWSIGFMLIIIVVVFVLFAVVLIKYRERPDNMNYEPPEVHGNTFLEIVWTGIPIIIVIALSIPTVKAIFDLEKPPQAANAEEQQEPLVIYATSADWKWIFSYPEQGIETVNYVNIPEDRPVEFKLTSADSMTALWIPELGGQKYAMAGMETTLYLQADHEGTYMGRNANFNGEGFAQMEFEVESQKPEEFQEWADEVKDTAPKLTEKEYNKEILKQSVMGRKSFSNTHLDFVDHAKQDTYNKAAEDHEGHEEGMDMEGMDHSSH